VTPSMKRSALAFLTAAVLVLPATASSKTERSREVAAQFQRENPCPSTGKQWGACPGWVKDHIDPLCNGGPDCRLKHAMANDRRRQGKGPMGERYLPGKAGARKGWRRMICLTVTGSECRYSWPPIEIRATARASRIFLASRL
jgi:hypothetical protein